MSMRVRLNLNLFRIRIAVEGSLTDFKVAGIPETKLGAAFKLIRRFARARDSKGRLVAGKARRVR